MYAAQIQRASRREVLRALDGERPLGKWKSHSDYDCSHRSRGFAFLFEFDFDRLITKFARASRIHLSPAERAAVTPSAFVISRACEKVRAGVKLH